MSPVRVLTVFKGEKWRGSRVSVHPREAREKQETWMLRPASADRLLLDWFGPSARGPRNWKGLFSSQFGEQS